MSNSVSVDARCQIVQEKTLPVIAAEIIQIERGVYASALDGAIQIGRKLIEAKEMVPTGEWVKWLKENLNYSQRQAYNFMEISNTYGDKKSPFYDLQTSVNLSLSKALALLQVPEEEVEKFVEETDVEDKSVRELREEIKQLKDENKHMSERLDAEKNLTKEAAAAADRLTKKLDKAKVEINSLKNNKDKAVEAALAKQGKKAAEEAEKKYQDLIDEKDASIKGMQAEIEMLEKKVANSQAEILLSFKVYVDQLQDAYSKCVSCMEQSGLSEDNVAAMRAALKQIVQEWVD